MADVDFDINSVIAHMPEVVAEVRAHAEEVALRAEALFAEHDRPGGHRIEVTHSGTDTLVSLVGPAPLSVEYGHWTGKRNRTHVEGLHILGRAAEL